VGVDRLQSFSRWSVYRGFIRKGDRVHINTFRVTTRLRSK
jgi:hypothetical protein